MAIEGFNGEGLASSQPYGVSREHVFAAIATDGAGRKVLRISTGNSSSDEDQPQCFGSIEVDVRHTEALRDHLTTLLGALK